MLPSLARCKWGEQEKKANQQWFLIRQQEQIGSVTTFLAILIVWLSDQKALYKY